MDKYWRVIHKCRSRLSKVIPMIFRTLSNIRNPIMSPGYTMLCTMATIMMRLTLVAACGFAVAAAQTRGAAGPYTARQASAGRVAYQANCASCHLADLAGRNEAP